MKIAGAVLLLSALVSAGEGFFYNRYVRYCRNGNRRSLAKADCDALGSKGMLECLGVTRHDAAIATVIRRCPLQLPHRPIFEQRVYRLYLANMPESFRAMLSRGRCEMMGQEMIRRLLLAFVYNKGSNVDKFAKTMTEHCLIGEEAWREFIRGARMHHQELLIYVSNNSRNQPNHTGYVQGASMHPLDANNPAPPPPASNLPPGAYDEGGSGRDGNHRHRHNIFNRLGRLIHPGPHSGTTADAAVPTRGGMQTTNQHQERALPGGERLLIDKQVSYAPGTPMAGITGSAAMGTYRGDPMRCQPRQVATDPLILTRLTPAQARQFGLLSDGCMALNEMHFKQPGLASDTVGSLPLACFQKIPPPAFAGLNAQMTAKIHWWPFVSRDQIRFVPPGDPIRAVPFDQLGLGRQRDREDREHPCWTITPDQLRAIRKSSKALREYRRRCIRSAAPPTASSPSTLGALAVGLAVGAALLA